MADVSDEHGQKARVTMLGADDSGYGLVMFVVFAAAVLFVTGAVALLALVGSWWMLGAAFAAHAGTTTVVTFVVIHAMGGRAVAMQGPDAPDARDAPRRRVRRQRAALAAHR